MAKRANSPVTSIRIDLDLKQQIDTFLEKLREISGVSVNRSQFAMIAIKELMRTLLKARNDHDVATMLVAMGRDNENEFSQSEGS